MDIALIHQNIPDVRMSIILSMFLLYLWYYDGSIVYHKKTMYQL